MTKHKSTQAHRHKVMTQTGHHILSTLIQYYSTGCTLSETTRHQHMMSTDGLAKLILCFATEAFQTHFRVNNGCVLPRIHPKSTHDNIYTNSFKRRQITHQLNREGQDLEQKRTFKSRYVFTGWWSGLHWPPHDHHPWWPPAFKKLVVISSKKITNAKLWYQ